MRPRAEPDISTELAGGATIRHVILYALVANDSDFAVDVFADYRLAAQALKDVLADEPDFAPLLAIEPVFDDHVPSPN